MLNSTLSLSMETQNIEGALFGTCLLFQATKGTEHTIVSHISDIITPISKCELTQEYFSWWVFYTAKTHERVFTYLWLFLRNEHNWSKQKCAEAKHIKRAHKIYCASMTDSVHDGKRWLKRENETIHSHLYKTDWAK